MTTTGIYSWCWSDSKDDLNVHFDLVIPEDTVLIVLSNETLGVEVRVWDGNTG